MTLMLLSAARRVWVTTRAWTPLLEPYLSGRVADVRVAAGSEQPSIARSGGSGRGAGPGTPQVDGVPHRTFRHVRIVGDIAAG